VIFILLENLGNKKKYKTKILTKDKDKQYVHLSTDWLLKLIFKHAGSYDNESGKL
jgi:hypothetical protein